MAWLTKSNYLFGLQCPRLLWVAKNQKERISEPDFVAKHNFEVGDLIGVLATKVFGDGVDLSDFDLMDNIGKTKDYLELSQRERRGGGNNRQGTV